MTFLPWLRRGLAQALTATDDGAAGPLATGPTVTARVELGAQFAERAVRLLGPEAATGLGPAQIVRTEPRADSAGVAPNYFPFVELAAADLPWLLTPARPDDSRGRLRPWLVLVCVRDQEGVSLTSWPGTALQVLRIGPPAEADRELPDLAESWAWAHVQSLAPVGGIASAVSGGSPDVVARLVCPRQLTPHSAWLACVVPAFGAGRLRGLGLEPAASATHEPAWQTPAPPDQPVELPVYHHWRFTTGASGDFEALCRRLKPDGEGADLGRHPLEVGDPGLIKSGASVRLSMEGALETPGVGSRPWPKTHRDDFQWQMTGLLNGGVTRTRFDAEAPDPVVAPPLYGVWPAGVRAVPRGGWVRELNLHPVFRAAAGLGAAVVRADQEALVAAAWEQACELQAAMIALNDARLAAEVAASVARRAAELDDPDLLQLTARLQAFLPVGATTVRARLVAGDVPAALISPAFLRQTRPGTPLARDWAARTEEASARLAADHVATTLAATKPGAGGDVRVALDFAVARAPAGMMVADPTLTAVVDPPTPDDPDPALLEAIDGLLGVRLDIDVSGRLPRRRRAAAARRTRTLPPVVHGSTSIDLSGLAANVRAALDPTAAVRASLLARIPALGDIAADAGLPPPPGLEPVFEDPLSDDLSRLSPSWMLPGVGRLRRNRVRLVEVNPTFVGAFMVGANHELARELLWRGYPVDLGGTFLRRFWSYSGTNPATDIDPLRGWKREASIDANMRESGASTVIVVRGDIVRRFPTAHYFLHEAGIAGDETDPVEGGVIHEPIFLGALSRDTVFFGFEPDSTTVRGDRPNGVPGYFLAIEEQAGAPRLGLDAARPRHFRDDPKGLDELSWGHLVRSQEALDALPHVPAECERLVALGELDGVTWGRNAAHLARACWQRPFRMYIHADLLV